MRAVGLTWGPENRAPGIIAVVVTLALMLAFVPAPTRASRPNGAGIVIRHGDGRIVYAYVEFTEPEITGDQLLARSHLPLVATPYGGLGQAVCSLDGEGCPATNCFCKSYQSPSFYWHYYGINPGGTWSNVNVGPSSRKIHDGDVDGWSWTTSAAGLPETSIDAIARMNGVDRAATTSVPTPTPTTVPTLAPAPTTRPPTPTVATEIVAPPTAIPTAPPATPTPAPTVGLTSTPSSPVAQVAATPVVAPSATAESIASPATPEGSPVARAVEVDPNGGSRPLTLATRSGGPALPVTAYVVFAVILATLAGLCAWLVVRKRPEDGP